MAMNNGHDEWHCVTRDAEDGSDEEQVEDAGVGAAAAAQDDGHEAPAEAPAAPGTVWDEPSVEQKKKKTPPQAVRLAYIDGYLYIDVADMCGGGQCTKTTLVRYDGLDEASQPPREVILPYDSEPMRKCLMGMAAEIRKVLVPLEAYRSCVQEHRLAALHLKASKQERQNVPEGGEACESEETELWRTVLDMACTNLRKQERGMLAPFICDGSEEDAEHKSFKARMFKAMRQAIARVREMKVSRETLPDVVEEAVRVSQAIYGMEVL